MTPVITSDAGLFGWWHVAAPPARRALVAASLGWALDAFDVMLFSTLYVAQRLNP